MFSDQLVRGRSELNLLAMTTVKVGSRERDWIVIVGICSFEDRASLIECVRIGQWKRDADASSSTGVRRVILEYENGDDD